MKHGRFKHGHRIGGRSSKVYNSWHSMRKRCLQPKNKNFSTYGGRGILICKRWMNFENFLADMGYPPSGRHSLDRIDNTKGYFPRNCRWITQREQCRNKRNNRTILYLGRKMTLVEWEEKMKLRQGTLSQRLNALGWSAEKALTTPIRKCERRIR